MCFAPGSRGACDRLGLYDTHYTERYLDRPQDNAAGYAASSVRPTQRLPGQTVLCTNGRRQCAIPTRTSYFVGCRTG